MAQYEIKANIEYNSNEIYFDSKPAADVLTALKGLKLRWNPRKGCWYGFASRDAIVSAIGAHDDDLGGVVSDGYMGAVRWDGNRSHENLYGADLSKAIRKELKRQNIKGCTVSCKTYSGGQSVTVSVSTTTADFVSRDEYISTFSAHNLPHWLYTDSGFQMHRDSFYKLDADEQKKALAVHARLAYDYSTGKDSRINESCISEYTEYTADFRRKLARINAVLDTFYYDNSNSLVDYFDTNFYRDIVVKAAA